ncbi:lipopolysaccharide biosynthesis protein [Polymorphum gilvum]|uniref:Polysaccharide biosynthesis associate n=1 Tax=Polymorphum gilvum (strain LMG 25793 / CGMCC 1.9160 / SL003B-26A1) TaxID=991905 RepID=F2J5G5_POLGS|nr:oligosaccharide flippase family protein [Polymorphum gilvum]ADZ72335.1 Polysaccharide biosynthesis associate [Polymorphum gilvum SL003B-26A1]
MKDLRARLAQIDPVGLLWSMGSRFGSTLLSFLVLYAASQSLETAEYGLYIFLFSIGSSLGLIFVFGQHVLLVKHYRLDGHAKGRTNQDILFVNACWLTLGAGALLLAAAAMLPFTGRLSPPYDALPIAFAFAAAFALSEYFQNYFRIHGLIALALAPRENIWRLLSAVALPLLAWAGLMHSGAAAMEVVTVLLGVAVGYQVYRFVRIEGLGFLGAARPRIDRGTLKAWNRETGFFSANTFFNSAAAYLETILIGIVLDLEAAAVYFVAYRISMLLTLPVLAIDTVGIPLISARFQDRDTAGAQRITALLSAGSFLCAVVGGLLLYFTGDIALALFDPQFEEHFAILAILCLAAITHAFFGPGTWLIMIGGGERYLLAMRSVVFVVYLGVLGGLGFTLGLAGVAFAGWFQLLAVHLLSRRWVIRRWSVDNAATAILPYLARSRAGAGPVAAGDGRKEASDASC